MVGSVEVRQGIAETYRGAKLALDQVIEMAQIAFDELEPCGKGLLSGGVEMFARAIDSDDLETLRHQKPGVLARSASEIENPFRCSSSQQILQEWPLAPDPFGPRRSDVDNRDENRGRSFLGSLRWVALQSD